jgi:hypothetical protein
MDVAKVDTVAQYLQSRRREWVWMYQWLRLESLQPSLGGRLSLLYRDPAKLDVLIALGAMLHIPYAPEEKSFSVIGAGFAPVNGIYRMVPSTNVNNTDIESQDNTTHLQQPHIHDNCPVFSMVSDVNHVEYTLFRCEMPSKAHRWYISHAPNKQTLGTLSDEDFYYCLCSIHEESPPEDGWRVWSKNPVATLPVPRVTLHSSSLQMNDNDSSRSIIASMNDNENDNHQPDGAVEFSHRRRRRSSNRVSGRRPQHTSFAVPDNVEMEKEEEEEDEEEEESGDYEDSEEEIRVSNERFQAVHLQSPDTT